MRITECINLINSAFTACPLCLSNLQTRSCARYHLCAHSDFRTVSRFCRSIGLNNSIQLTGLWAKFIHYTITRWSTCACEFELTRRRTKYKLAQLTHRSLICVQMHTFTHRYTGTHKFLFWRTKEHAFTKRTCKGTLARRNTISRAHKHGHTDNLVILIAGHRVV